MPSTPSQARPLLVVLAALLLAACGATHQVRGEPPLVGLEGLSRDDGGLLLDISIRNINDFRLDIASLDLRLEFEGQTISESIGEADRLSISPRGREVIRVPAAASPQALEQLSRLSDGDQANLPWHLEVRIDSTNRSSAPAEARGFLHAVPGQPDRFR